jgi:hypothetical protein
MARCELRVDSACRLGSEGIPKSCRWRQRKYIACPPRAARIRAAVRVLRHRPSSWYPRWALTTRHGANLVE